MFKTVSLADSLVKL